MRETNEHQSGPSGLVIFPAYQQFHAINVSTSHDESPARSESPSGSSGSGSEQVNKRCEATKVKILISAYKDHHENLNKQVKSRRHDSKRTMDIRNANSLESNSIMMTQEVTLGNRFSHVTAGTTGNENPSVLYHGEIYHGKSHLLWCV